jgi:hypothetical protein
MATHPMVGSTRKGCHSVIQELNFNVGKNLDSFFEEVITFFMTMVVGLRKFGCLENHMTYQRKMDNR